MAKTLHYGLGEKEQHDAFAKLLKALNGDGAKDRPYQLAVANALWVQKGYQLLKSFTDLNAASYGADMEELNFADSKQAADTINKWVEAKTNEKIKDLVPAGALDASTRLVLTNAIYFKGDWQDKFDSKLTKDDTFHISAAKTVQAPMMNQKRHYDYAKADDCQVIRLPYATARKAAGNETGKPADGAIHGLSMLVLLPGKVDGLAELEKSLTVERLKKLSDSLCSEEVELSLPKFTMTWQGGLGQTLVQMGMKDAFDPAKADFTGMTTSRELFISAVIHKAFVDVNEEGTEAAAATAVIMTTLSVAMPKEPVKFVADHPFVFIIRDDASGAILFMGRVANPTDK